MGGATEILEILRDAETRFNKKELAGRLGVDPKTIARWERGETHPSALELPQIREILMAEKRKAGNGGADFTFIDLFAGIGGNRKAFEMAGGRCVFTSEWNAYAVKTYKANFSHDHHFEGDITKVDEETIPDHDVLLAGFPCQAFSIAGVSKKNSLGRDHGFKDKTQGTLFFDVARILAAKRPKAFLLENVKNLVSHDKGNTFRIIRETLEKELGYYIEYRVVDGQRFVPQHRERILIAGFRKDAGFRWDDVQLPVHGPRLQSILHPEDGTEAAEEPYTSGKKARVADFYTLSDNLWAYLQGYAAKHKAAGNGFGFGLVDGTCVTRTLSARYHKDGSEILLSQGGRKNPRRLTPRECSRLMGFPADFIIPVSDTQAYRQFGNSVVMPVMAAAAKAMKPAIITLIEQEKNASQLTLA
ncbi:DNA (cytosine-5)-methyltransferase 1 [Variovorax sp. GrIS 2.14]|uniref:DNA (cytosine-5-)-methyltransferase n=1 Tax=Variovorax sp. GrIS 2.14 TaxID=3071709 RepID=UPI0038F6FD00